MEYLFNKIHALMTLSKVPRLPFLCCLALLLAGCGGDEAEEPAAPPVEITLQEELAIESGEDEAEGDPILASVSTVATGPDGTLYIYDGRSHRIMKYDAQGNFLGAFGREGKGPGEFGTVLALAVDREGRIIVSDGGNARFSIYDGDGNLLGSQPISLLRSARDIEEMPDGNFLVAGWHSENNRMLHIFSADLSRIEQSLAPLDELARSDDARIMDAYRSRPGTAAVLAGDRIAFAPTYYAGEILLYESNGSGEWALSGRMRGYERVEEPVMASSQSSSSITSDIADIPTASIISISIMQGNMDVIHTPSRSYGIFADRNGNLVHFSVRFGEEGYRYVTENFNPGAAGLVRHGPLFEGMEESYSIEGMAADGSLYLSQPDSARFLKMSMEGLF